MVYRKLREFIGHIRDGASSRRTITVWSIQEWAARNRRIARVVLEEPAMDAAATELRTSIVHVELKEPALPNETLTPGDLIDAWRSEISEVCPPQTSIDVRLLNENTKLNTTDNRLIQTIYEATPQAGGPGARR